MGLKEVFNELQASQEIAVPIDILILLDGSGSVADNDYATAKFALTNLIQGYGDEVRIGIIQFSSKVLVECGLEVNKSFVMQRLVQSTQLKGSTATHLGLDECAKMFFYKDKSGNLIPTRPDCKRYVLLVTDGAADDHNQAKASAQKLTVVGVDIIAIGVGNVQENALNDLSSGKTVTISNYNDLIQLIPRKAGRNDEVPGSEIHLAIHLVDQNQRYSLKNKQPFQVVAEIQNYERQPVPAGSLVIFDGGRYFRKFTHVTTRPIGQNEKYLTPPVTIELLAALTIDTLPEILEIRVMEPSGNKRFKSAIKGFSLEPRFFAGDLLIWRPPKPVFANLLVFGWMGAGKSSLINNLLSLFLDEQRSFATVGALDTHVTVELGHYNWQSLQNMTRDVLSFNLIDSPGLTESTYGDVPFAHLLKGTLPPDWRLGDQRDLQQYASNQILSGAAPTTEIHSVLLVVPQGIRVEDATIRTLKHYYTLIIRANLRPLLVVTFMDAVPKNRWEEIRTQFHNLIGIGKKEIFLVDNTDAEHKTFQRDITMLSIFDTAQRNMADCINRKYQNLPPVPSPVKVNINQPPTGLPPGYPVQPEFPASPAPQLGGYQPYPGNASPAGYSKQPEFPSSPAPQPGGFQQYPGNASPAGYLKQPEFPSSPAPSPAPQAFPPPANWDTVPVVGNQFGGINAPQAFPGQPPAALPPFLPPPVLQQEKAQVLSSYSSSQPGVLQLSLNETVIVLDKNCNGWWKCRNQFGQEGFAPPSYLRILP